MRKSDYQHLAATIRKRTDAAGHVRDNTADPEKLRAADAMLRTFEELAHDLARGLHVDRATFLNACGV